jgi:hypothetical protein
VPTNPPLAFIRNQHLRHPILALPSAVDYSILNTESGPQLRHSRCRRCRPSLRPRRSKAWASNRGALTGATSSFCLPGVPGTQTPPPTRFFLVCLLVPASVPLRVEVSCFWSGDASRTEWGWLGLMWGSRPPSLPLPRLPRRVWWRVGSVLALAPAPAPGYGSGAPLATGVRPAPHTAELSLIACVYAVRGWLRGARRPRRAWGARGREGCVAPRASLTRCSAPLATVVRPAPHTAEWPPTLCDCLCVCGVWVVARGAGRDVQGGPVMPGGGKGHAGKSCDATPRAFLARYSAPLAPVAGPAPALGGVAADYL